MQMHASKSETVGQIFPEGIERQLRAELRQFRFGRPQEYAQWQQAEVRKFLSSKSVHSWLSEWELSHAFGNGFGTWDSGGGGSSRRHSRHQQQQWQQPQQWSINSSIKSNAAVQCQPEEIDAEVAQAQANSAFAFAEPSSAPYRSMNLPCADDFDGNAVNLRAHSQQPAGAGLPQYQPYWHPFPPLMDASTNTQTTETTGTGGMNVYRRASYLEEYAMERVREMEEERHAKEARQKQREVERKRRKRANWWRRCFFCCCTSRLNGASSSEDRSTSSTSSGCHTATTSKKLSSSTGGFDQLSTAPRRERRHLEEPKIWAAQPIVVVKRATLSRSGPAGPVGNGFGPGAGNYDNVTPPPPPMNGQANWIR